MGWMNIITKVSHGKLHWEEPLAQAFERMYHRWQGHTEIEGLTNPKRVAMFLSTKFV